MASGRDKAAIEASKNIEKTIVQLKGLLEQIVSMRVECSKLEFDMLSLYHTTCPEELEGLRDDQDQTDIAKNVDEQN